MKQDELKQWFGSEVLMQVFRDQLDELKVRAVFPEASVTSEPCENCPEDPTLRTGCRAWNAFGVGQTSRDQDDKTDDIAFLANVLEAAQTFYSVDERRRYVVGFGQGALMGQAFGGCNYPHVHSAVVSINGLPPVGTLGNESTCPAQNETYASINQVAVHHLQVVGTDNNVMPPSGGKAQGRFTEDDFVTTSASDVALAWADLALCNSSVARLPGAIDLVEEGSGEPNNETDRTIYGIDCVKEAGSSELWTIDGAGYNFVNSDNTRTDKFSQVVMGWLALKASSNDALPPDTPIEDSPATNSTAAPPPSDNQPANSTAPPEMPPTTAPTQPPSDGQPSDLAPPTSAPPSPVTQPPDGSQDTEPPQAPPATNSTAEPTPETKPPSENQPGDSTAPPEVPPTTAPTQPPSDSQPSDLAPPVSSPPSPVTQPPDGSQGTEPPQAPPPTPGKGEQRAPPAIEEPPGAPPPGSAQAPPPQSGANSTDTSDESDDGNQRNASDADASSSDSNNSNGMSTAAIGGISAAVAAVVVSAAIAAVVIANKRRRESSSETGDEETASQRNMTRA